MSGFENFNETLPSKKEFNSFFSSKGATNKEHEHVFKVWNKF